MATQINIDEIISQIEVPANLKGIYDKTVLAGMRIMFDKKSHHLMLEQMDKEGPVDQRLAAGIIGLMYMLWQKSNQTIPPQIIVPVTVVLTLRAFEFLQKSGEPGADAAALGEGLALAVSGIMAKFGVDEAQIEQMAQQAGKQGGLAKGAM
jgi:hypothetical protein